MSGPDDQFGEVENQFADFRAKAVEIIRNAYLSDLLVIATSDGNDMTVNARGSHPAMLLQVAEELLQMIMCDQHHPLIDQAMIARCSAALAALSTSDP